MNRQQLFEALDIAVQNNDFERYNYLVESNLDIINNMMDDFWRHLYSESSRPEIKFWLDFSLITQSIDNIALIPEDKDDLFYYALDKDIYFSGAEQIIEMWKESLESQPEDIYLIYRIKALESLL